MKRKFKFLGTRDEKGKLVAKNFGRYDLIQPGRVIEAKDDTEAEALEQHPEFEEVKEKTKPAPTEKPAQ